MNANESGSLKNNGRNEALASKKNSFCRQETRVNGGKEGAKKDDNKREKEISV